MWHIPSKHRGRLAQGVREYARRTDAPTSCAASRQVPIDQHVAVGRVRAMMLVFEVSVEAADLLPLDDRKHGIEGVEVCDLDVGRIDVLGAAADKGDPLPRMIPLLRRADGHP